MKTVLINIGFGNAVAAGRVVAVITPTSASGKRIREEAKENEQKPESDPTRINPGDYYQTNWVQRYARELSYFSDKRYHYKGSGACYYRMGEAMANAILQIAK